MAPAQAQQIVAHGLGQIAHVAIGFHRQRTMALGQLGAIRAVDQRQVAVDRHGCAHLLDQLQLTGGVVQMVGAADHMGHAHVGIVHHHRQHVGWRAIGAQQHHVVQLAVLEPYIAQHLIMDDGLAVLAGAQAHHERLAIFGRTGRTVAPAAVIAHRFAGGLLFLAHGSEFFGGGVAAIGFSFRQQLFHHFAVPGGAGELVDDIAVPVQAHPGHAVQDRLHRLGGGTFAVGILDPQKEGAAGVAGIEPVEQRGARAADMQHACGRGGKAQDRFGVFGHDGRGLKQGCVFGKSPVVSVLAWGRGTLAAVAAGEPGRGRGSVFCACL